MKCCTGMSMTIVCLCLIASLHGQSRYELPQITPKSPNAAEFGKYGEIPVTLSNGITHVSIPLLKIQVGSFELPVSLDYRSNGFKLDDIPSYTGLGFHLNAGGVINYEQRGNPDFSTATNGMFSPFQLFNPVDSLKRYFRNQMTTLQRYNYLKMVIEGQVDSEYDLYHFNFMGRSGSFYLDSNQRIVSVPKSNLKIVRANGDFYITDEQGNQFYFGTIDHNELSPNADEAFAIRRSFNENASYLLTRVRTAENREIYFSYVPYPIEYQSSNQYLNHFAAPKPYHGCPGSNSGTGYTFYKLNNHLLRAITFDGGSIQFDLSTAYRTDLKTLNAYANIPYLEKVRLLNAQQTLITAYNLKYSNSTRLRLDEIIRTGSGNPEKWRFEYYGDTSFPSFLSRSKDHWGFYNGSYNPSGMPAADYSRLVFRWVNNPMVGANRESSSAALQGMLKKIVYPTGGSTFFQYESNRIRFTSVEQITSNPFFRAALGSHDQYVAMEATDQQAEINGSFTLDTLTLCKIMAHRDYMPLNWIDSYVSLSTTYGGANMLLTLNGGYSCNLGSCNVTGEALLPAGTYYYTLKRNMVEFHEEEGYASLIVTRKVYDPVQPYQVGGFRIASIESNDSTGNSLLKRYIYGDRFDSVYFRSRPWYISRSNLQIGIGGACIDCGIQTSVHEESIVPLIGNPVEYLYVTELSDHNGKNGKTDYVFTRNETLSDEGSQPYVIPFMATWRSGQLKSKKVYKKAGANFILVQQDSLEYEFTYPFECVTRGLKAAYGTYCDLSGPMYREIYTTHENYQTEKFYQKSLAQTTYDNTGNIRTGSRQYFASTKHTLPTEVKRANSTRDTIIERTKYSADYDTSGAVSAEASGIRNLQRKNVLKPIEQLTIKMINNIPHVVAGRIYTYKSDTAVPMKVYQLNIVSPLPLSSFVSSSNTAGQFLKDARYEERAEFMKYDAFQNVLQERNTDNRLKSYQWDYNNRYLTCEVVPAAQQDIAYTSFETSNTGGWAILSPARDTTTAVTGKRSYNQTTDLISKTGLSIGKQYMITYWSKAGAKTITGASITTVAGSAINGWTFYQHVATATGTTISLSGAGLIDELRLYPAAAQMTTYTWEPLIGITSTCDPNNQIIYYEYDDQNRLLHVRDQHKNILKKMAYKYGARNID